MPWYKRVAYNNHIARAFPGTRSESFPLNETFAEVLALEVLANQALDDDILAKQVFFQTLDGWLRVVEGKESGGKISGEHFLYSYRPGKAVVAALTGVKPRHGGIELDATVKLIMREIEKVTRPPKHGFSAPSALERSALGRYCLA